MSYPYFTGNHFAILLRFYVPFEVEESQSLFYWKPLCNLQCIEESERKTVVTILILLETTLQLEISTSTKMVMSSHNPYFTGNHFAILQMCIWKWNLIIVTILILLETTLQFRIVGQFHRTANVTILILLETTLQSNLEKMYLK